MRIQQRASQELKIHENWNAFCDWRNALVQNLFLATGKMKCYKYKNFLYDILSFLQRADQIGLSHRGTVLNRTNVKVLLKRQYEAIINSSTQVRYIFICTDEVDKYFILLLAIAGSGAFP